MGHVGGVKDKKEEKDKREEIKEEEDHRKRKEGSTGGGDHIILWKMDKTSAKTDKWVMWEV